MMPRPLYPDEWISGYRGHLTYIYGDPTVLDHSFEPTPGGIGKKPRPNAQNQAVAPREKVPLTLFLLERLPFVSQAAVVAQMDVQDVIWLHSLAPFHLLLKPEQRAINDAAGGYVRMSPYGTEIMKIARPHGFACAHCIQEDLGFWGGSYWRRSHQLPGTYFCSKHGTALHRANRGYAELMPPNEAIDAWEHLPQYPEIAESETVREFVELTNITLDEGLAIDPVKAHSALVQQAHRIGLGPMDREFSQRIRVHMASCVPLVWLKDLTRNGERIGTDGGSSIHAFLRRSSSAISPQLLLLMAISLFGNAREALKGIQPIKVRHVPAQVKESGSNASGETILRQQTQAGTAYKV